MLQVEKVERLNLAHIAARYVNAETEEPLAADEYRRDFDEWLFSEADGSNPAVNARIAEIMGEVA